MKINFRHMRKILIFFMVFSLATLSFSDDYRKEIFQMVNAERTANGLPKLEIDERLNALADKKAKIMADEKNLSHTAGGYSSFSDLIKENNIKYWTVGENIASGWRTPKEVMEAWLASKGHRANILNPKFSHIGLGKAVDSDGKIYWVQLFIKERTE